MIKKGVPMITKQYQRRPDSWWQGKLVVTLKTLTNKNMVIAPGTVCQDYRKYSGLHLRGERCSHCGVGVNVTRVGFDQLVLFDRVVEDEESKAVQRAKQEKRSVVKWKGRYLVLPPDVASYSPYEAIYCSA